METVDLLHLIMDCLAESHYDDAITDEDYDDAMSLLKELEGRAQLDGRV